MLHAETGCMMKAETKISTSVQKLRTKDVTILQLFEYAIVLGRPNYPKLALCKSIWQIIHQNYTRGVAT